MRDSAVPRRPLSTLVLLALLAAAAARELAAAEPNCQGVVCATMSALLPKMRFRRRGYRIRCNCQDYDAGVCFAPGCFPCAKSCFTGADTPLANLPGPFGTGLLCSTGCRPCCQRRSDPHKARNSTCDLVGRGC